MTSEQIDGSEIRIGDIVRSVGHSWRVDRIFRDTKPHMDRWYVYATNLDPKGPYGRGGMELGLRVDLKWTRLVTVH